MSKSKNIIPSKGLKSAGFNNDAKDYRVHKPYDKYFKNLMSIAGEGFMKLIGYPIKIKHFHNTEKINEISGELHIDNLIESFEPKMYINEFHTGHISNKDLMRYGSYQVLVFKETGLETIVNIISLNAKEDSNQLYGFGEYFDKVSSSTNDLNSLKIEYGFTPHVKSLTSLDLSLYLNMMDKIIENNKMPDEYDLAILLTIPFMTDVLEKRKELIFKTYEIASKLNIIDKNILVELKSNQRLLAQHVLDIDELDKFKRGDKMLSEEDLRKLDLYEKEAIKEVARRKFIAKIRGEVREEMRGEVRKEVRGEVIEEMRGEVREEVRGEVRGEVREEVREEVKEELMQEAKVLGEEEVVTKLLKDGFKVEDVLKYTNLNKAHVITLSNSIFFK